MHAKCYINADIAVKLQCTNKVMISLDWPLLVTVSNYNEKMGISLTSLRKPYLIGAAGSAAAVDQLRPVLCSRAMEIMKPTEVIWSWLMHHAIYVQSSAVVNHCDHWREQLLSISLNPEITIIRSQYISVYSIYRSQGAYIYYSYIWFMCLLSS